MTTTEKPQTIGSIIDTLWSLREKKKKLEAQIKDVEKQISGDPEVPEDKGLEGLLMDRLAAEGMEKATGSKASVSITATTVANVNDWDEFWKFIIKHKYTHMLQKRVSDPAYRELLERKVKVPGVTPYTKHRVNLRTL